MNNKLQYWIELNRVKLFYKILHKKFLILGLVKSHIFNQASG